MPAAELAPTEPARLATLRSYGVLDTPPEPDLDEITRYAAQASGCPVALISLVDEARQWFKAQVGLAVRQTPRAEAFCAHAILRPEAPLVVPDAREDPRFADNPLVIGAPHIRFYAGAPLVTPVGHALGTLCVIDYRTRAADTEAPVVEMLRVLSGAAMARLEVARMRHLRPALAGLDPLTGLENKEAFLERLADAIAEQRRGGRHVSLMVLELDGLPRFNAAWGHAAGDSALRGIAGRLRACFRREDAVARIGGARFAALLPGGKAGEIASLAARLHALASREADGSLAARLGTLTFPAPPADASAALAAARARVPPPA
jgi:diguanylate cyclase (GGDEF)-like protein